MNPVDVERILAECEKRPVPPKPDAAALLSAAEHFGVQVPYRFIRAAGAR